MSKSFLDEILNAAEHIKRNIYLRTLTRSKLLEEAEKLKIPTTADKSTWDGPLLENLSALQRIGDETVAFLSNESANAEAKQDQYLRLEKAWGDVQRFRRLISDITLYSPPRTPSADPKDIVRWIDEMTPLLRGIITQKHPLYGSLPTPKLLDLCRQARDSAVNLNNVDEDLRRLPPSNVGTTAIDALHRMVKLREIARHEQKTLTSTERQKEFPSTEKGGGGAHPFYDAMVWNLEVSRKLHRFFAIKLGWGVGLSGHDEERFWKEFEQRWRQWLGVAPPFDDGTWRKLALRLGLTPPEALDESWLKKHLLPALQAKQEGPIPELDAASGPRKPLDKKKDGRGRRRRSEKEKAFQKQIAENWWKYRDSKVWVDSWKLGEGTAKEQFCSSEKIAMETLESALRQNRR